MPPLDSFADRAHYLTRFIAASPLPPSWDWRRRLLHHSIARLGLGIRTGEALGHVAKVVEDPGHQDLMFLRHPLADITLRFSGLVPPALQESIRLFLCRAEDYGLQGGTENHKLMNAVSGYLTAQIWPDWPDSPAVADTCSRYLNSYFDQVVRYGQGEFDSSTYSVLYLNTLATLHDFAADPLMKRKAAMMLDWYLLNTAGEWLNGHFAGAQSRDYGSVNGPDSPGGGQVGAWLYFGGDMPGLLRGEPHYSVINALSAYRFPEEFAGMAANRPVPYTHLESHDLTALHAPTHDNNETRAVPGADSDLKGYGYISKAGVRKTTYMHARYALGSMTDGLEGDVIWSGQLRRWSLKWDSLHPHAVMFVTHPFPDFNPETDQYRAKWQGSSPYEQVLQHEGTLLAVYRVPCGGTYKFAPRQPFPSDRDPYVEGFISSTAIVHQLEKDGWLFAHGGAVLFGLRTVKPYEWVCDETRSTDHLIHGRIRSYGLHNGLIVETGEASAAQDDPSAQQQELVAFAEKILKTTELAYSGMEDGQDSPPSLTYRSLQGNVLFIQYDGSRFIDGNAISESAWPLIHNPYVHSAIGSGMMTVEIGGYKRMYDFTNWTVE